jgi:hypothetical protein
MDKWRFYKNWRKIGSILAFGKRHQVRKLLILIHALVAKLQLENHTAFGGRALVPSVE